MIEASAIATDRSGMRADPGSFRDPRGRVFLRGGRVFRSLSSAGAADWQSVSGTRLFQQGVASGRIVAAWPLPADAAAEVELPEAEPAGEVGSGPGNGAWLEHPPLPWIGYPYEWSFGMLRDAALLQLDILLEGLSEGLVLRDGTPYNVQFVGARPILMDVLSLGPFDPRTLWPGYRQFCETQLFPLLLAAYRGVDFRPWLRGSLGGLPAGECRRLLGWSGWWRRGVFSHVVLQDWLSRQAEAAPRRPASPEAPTARSAADARRLVAHNVRGLRSLVAGLKLPGAASAWSDYDSTRSHYTPEDRERKDRFVERVFADGTERPLVWDIGCNTGRFSRIAARSAECVLAIDADPVCVDRLYARLRDEDHRRIVPMAANLADTAGGLGWRGRERRSLYERRRPATVLALAVIHHFVFVEGIPLEEVVDWLSDLADELVVEFAGPDDPMVRVLRTRRDVQHPGYDEANFLARLERTHAVVQQDSLCGGNRLLVRAVSRGRNGDRNGRRS